MGDNERNYLLNTLLHVEELIEQQSVSLRNVEKLLNENRKQLIEQQKRGELLDERLTALASEVVNLRGQITGLVSSAADLALKYGSVVQNLETVNNAASAANSCLQEEPEQNASVFGKQGEQSELSPQDGRGDAEPALPEKTQDTQTAVLQPASGGNAEESVEDEWHFLDEQAEGADDSGKSEAAPANDDEGEAEEWKPETAAQDASGSGESKSEPSAGDEGEAEEWKPEPSADDEGEAEEWKPETAVQDASGSGESKSESSADDEGEAEEWKPESAAQDASGSGESKSESSADDEGEAEEWKPETPADDEGEAEEWKPETAAADSKQAVESGDSEDKQEDGVSLLKSLGKDKLLFKGRYADVSWETNSDDELISAIGSCLELPSEETHKALGDLLRLHPWSWRVRLQLFNFEMEEGRPFYAFVVGWPLLYAPMRPAIKKAFKRDMTKVINDVIAYSVTPSEERWKFLRLAELVIEDNQDQALEYVNKALNLNDRASNEDSRLRFYRQCLAGVSQNSFKDCVSALQNVDSHIELFGDLQQSIMRYCRGYKAIDNVIQALLYQGRETAKDLEGTCELAGEELNVNLLEKVHDDNADLLIELIFNQIYKRIPMPDVTTRTAAEEELLKNSTTMTSSNFPTLGLLRRINRLVFGLDYDVKVYIGPQRFWAEVVMGKRPTILLHRDCAELDPVNQQALLLHRLFQLHHRHHIIRRIHDVMTSKDRLQLMHVLCDITSEAGVDSGVEFRAILNNLKETDNNFEDKLEKLVNAVFMRTGSFEFAAGHELMFSKRPFTDILDAASDRFVARVLGMTDASYSIALRQINDYDLFKKIEDEGFSVIYEPQYSKYFLLRLRLQRLWTAPLQEELWF